MARLTFESILAADCFRLAVAYFDSFRKTDSSRVVVVNAGAGVSQAFYAPFAAWLADQGIPVILYDYRGIGRSRGKSIRRLDADIYEWGSKDCARIFQAATERYPRATMSVIGHSVGSIVTGFVNNPPKIERMLLVSPHTGYFGDYAPRAKPRMFVQWHVLMPLVTRVVGFFPGRFLGLPEDLPYNVAISWAKRRFRWNTGKDMKHGVFSQIVSKSLIVRPEDDPFATTDAARRVRGHFPNVEFCDHVLRLNPGERAIGHFGFFHPRSRESMWPIALDWLGG